MENTSKKIRSALFSDKISADLAYENALKHGYRPGEINVLMSEKTKKQHYSFTKIAKIEVSDKSMEGLAIGGALGGTIGGVLAALLALSTTIIIPGIGLVVAGPLAAGLVGAGAGSVAGGLLGSLIGAGIPEEHAKLYESGIKSGGTVIIVDSRGPKDEVLLDDWKKNQGSHIF